MWSCYQLILFHLLLKLGKGFAEDLLELNCNVNSDCNHVKRTTYNTTCLDGQCLCNNMNGERVQCKPIVNNLNNIIGGMCPCIQPHTECNQKDYSCYCKSGYVPSSDRRRCIKKDVVLGENCEDNSQCLGLDKFSECHMKLKKCMCQKNFIDHSGICISVVGLENRCIDNEQCLNLTANSTCYKNTCTCIRGYTASDDLKCLPYAGYKETCKDDNQCKHKLGAGSECYMGSCACDYRHFANEIEENGQKRFICERRIVYGDYCVDHNDCYQYHLNAEEQSMECFFGECRCRDGFHNVNGDCIKNGSTIRHICFQLLFLLNVSTFFFLKY